MEADVVIVGSGATAHCAAIEAARAGASVLMLEKTSMVGGDSALCDGILGTAGTRLAKAVGIELTTDDVYAWYMETPAWYGGKDPEVTRANAENGAATVDWLEELGVEFEPESAARFGYTDLPFIHQVVGKGAAMMEVLEQTAADEGVETLLETPVTALVQDDEGRVVGVEATQAAGTLRVGAGRGVVLACGDESGSSAMMSALSPENAGLVAGSYPGDTGDGIVLAAQAGAHLTRLSDVPQLTTLAGMMTGTYVNVNYETRLHGLWLDADAQRFYDEEARYFDPMMHRAIMRKANEQGFFPILLLGDNPEVQAPLESQPLDAWGHADTLEELAPLVGLDADALVASVERFNGFCEAGVDEDFGRDPEYLVPMTGPFYAASMMQSTSCTMGGVKVDASARVLRLVIGDGTASPLEPVGVSSSAPDLRARTTAWGLTGREGVILKLWVTSHGARQIGERLGLSESTVKTHLRHIYEKSGVHSRAELIALLENAS